MHWDRLEGNWKQFKGAAREQSSKLTNSNWETVARCVSKTKFPRVPGKTPTSQRPPAREAFFLPKIHISSGKNFSLLGRF